MWSPGRPASLGEAIPKPTILVADDHPDVLKSVSRLLSFDFDVVAAVTSGDHAIDAVGRLDPDLVVLDITMPGRNGFQTARDLRQRAARAPIVFLTMHESEEFVAEAFRSGARGYVVKTQLHVELVSTLKHVLAGQLVLPSLRSLFVIDPSALGHVLQFHADDVGFVDSIGSFLNAGLRHGDAVSVVGTASVRASLAKRLREYGWSVGASGASERYRADDSTAAASWVVSDGRPVPDRIAGYVRELERWRTDVAGPDARLTVVGDISTQLLLSGDVDSAMEVEHLWSDLTRALPFLTVCCYPMTSFADEGHPSLLPHLCAEHFAVAHTPEGGIPSLI